MSLEEEIFNAWDAKDPQVVQTNFQKAEEFFNKIKSYRHNASVKPDELDVWRSERDLWLLLSNLSKQRLFLKYDDDITVDQTQNRVRELNPADHVQFVIEMAFLEDIGSRKGKIIVKWLEECCQDRVKMVKKPDTKPWQHTFDAIKNSGTKGKPAVKQMDPDAQLEFNERNRTVKMLNLEGHDRDNQEKLLNSIWQLIRSGQLDKALIEAKSNQLFWLTASLQGSMDVNYEEQDDGELEGVRADERESTLSYLRSGNIRNAVSARTSWRYADALFDCEGNRNFTANGDDGKKNTFPNFNRWCILRRITISNVFFMTSNFQGSLQLLY